MTVTAGCEREHGEERGVGVGTELHHLIGSDASALISRGTAQRLMQTVTMPTTSKTPVIYHIVDCLRKDEERQTGF